MAFCSTSSTDVPCAWMRRTTSAIRSTISGASPSDGSSSSSSSGPAIGTRPTAFRCGKRLYDWNTIPVSRRWAGTRVTFSPSTSTSPESGCSKPASMRSAVVLPQPDGPSRARSSPGRTDRSSPSRATVPPKSRRRARNSTEAGPGPERPAVAVGAVGVAMVSATVSHS